MKIHFLKNPNIEVGVSEESGNLFPVRFFFDDKIIEPMHIAPWSNEELDSSIPPVLKNLKGDFFCAPFGDSDILEEEERAHGSSANEIWDNIKITQSSMVFQLSKKICGAELIKEIAIHDGESVVYQKHTFKGGKGKIPVGHHAMLKVSSKGFLSFSDFIFGGAPSQAVETNSDNGRSILKYPQEFSDITSIKLSDDKITDASIYPFENNHEDLYMVVSRKDIPFGWSAFSCPNEGWLWFSIKNIETLPNTVIWLSNAGRYYPPFSSRHKNVIGIEETASYFHLGHKASINENELNIKGFKTYIELVEDRKIIIPYIFGVIQIPSSFGKVKTIREIRDGIEITDYNGNKVQTKVEISFIKEVK